MLKLDLLIYIINIVIVIFLMFFVKKPPSSVLLWSFILLFLPVIGLILYFFFGREPNFDSRKRFLNKCTEDKKYLELKKEQLEIVDAEYSEEIKDIITLNLKSDSLISTDNEVEIFDKVDDFYGNMLKEIEEANNSIYAEYYRIRDDESGRAFVNALAKKAAEGIDVKLVYDDLGCIGLRYNFFDCIKKSGGEVYPFYPTKIKIIRHNLNYRNHRKMLIIDGVCAFIGGSNIGDEYLSKGEDGLMWTDLNLKIKGTAAMHLGLRFVQDYSFASKKRIDMEFVGHKIKNRLPVQILFDGPDTVEGNIEQSYIKAIYGAKKRVYIQTPYLIPDQAFMLALTSVAKAGIDVRVMIPENPDKRFVYYSTLSYVTELVKQGVKVYKKRGFLHSKAMLIDDCISSVGSFNLDIRSFYLQFELTAFIYDKDFNEKLSEIFSENLADSKEFDSNSLSSRTVIQKMAEKIMRLLSPIM